MLYKSPSRRELAPQATEGERVTMENIQSQDHAGSFHRFVVPPSSRRKAFSYSPKGSKKHLWKSLAISALVAFDICLVVLLRLDKHGFCVRRSDFVLSICRRYARLDILPSANSICFGFAQTRYDINPRSRSEHIELLMAHSCHQQYIERISVYRKSASADLYRCVPALWQVRQA